MFKKYMSLLNTERFKKNYNRPDCIHGQKDTESSEKTKI